MEAPIIEVKRSTHWLKTLMLVAGVVILAAGQLLLSVGRWFSLDENGDTFRTLEETSCNLIPICRLNLRYPSIFGLALVILLLALVLLGLVLRQSALRTTHDVEWTTALTAVKPGRWHMLSGGFALAALAVTVVNVQAALLTEDRFPDPLLWFVAILLAGSAFYCWDRGSRRQTALSRSEIIGLVAYLVLLLSLGLVYTLPALQSSAARVMLVLVAALILLACWQVKLIDGMTVVWVMIAVTGLAVYTYNINSWRYSWIGDEYSFYNTASGFLTNPSDFKNILDARGVYDSHPVFSSVIQAASMSVFGVNIYGWRFSEMLMVFLSAPAIYVLVRQLKGRWAGILAVVVFVSAPPIVGFAHIGYNQLQALPGFTAMLAFAVLALQRGSRLAVFLSGVGAAFAFYAFSVAIPLIPLPLLLVGLWVLWPTSILPFKRRLINGILFGGVFVVAVLLMASPRLLNTTWLNQAASNTILSHSEISGMTNPLFQQIVPNAVYLLSASLTFNDNSHYVSGAHSDPLTSALLLVGIAGLMAIVTRRCVAAWLLISFLVTTFFVGGLVPYPYPSNTRGFMEVVFYAIFAALGAAYVGETLLEIGLRFSPLLARTAFAAIALVIVALNGYQFFHLSNLELVRMPTAMVVREFELSPPGTTFYYVAQESNDQNLLLLLNIYHFDTNRLKPVMGDNPLQVLRAVERDAVPPYRVLFMTGWSDVQRWLDAAQKVWPGRPFEFEQDDSGVLAIKVIDVPAE